MTEILSSYPSGLASKLLQIFWPSLHQGPQRQGRTQQKQLPVDSSIKLCEQLRVCCDAALLWQLGDVWEARPNGMGGHIGGRQEASRDWLVYTYCISLPIVVITPESMILRGPGFLAVV